FFRTQDDAADPGDYSHGIPQVLKLLNAVPLTAVAPAAQRLAQSGLGREAAIEQLFLSTLSRRPAAEVTALMVCFLDQRNDNAPADGYSAVLWALLNSSEFVVNR